MTFTNFIDRKLPPKEKKNGRKRFTTKWNILFRLPDPVGPGTAVFPGAISSEYITVIYGDADRIFLLAQPSLSHRPSKQPKPKHNRLSRMILIIRITSKPTAPRCAVAGAVPARVRPSLEWSVYCSTAHRGSPFSRRFLSHDRNVYSVRSGVLCNTSPTESSPGVV